MYLLYCKPKNWPSFTKNVPEINHTFQWSRNKNPHELSLPYYYAKKAKFPIKIEKPEFLKKTIPVSCFLDYFVIGFGNKNSTAQQHKRYTLFIQFWPFLGTWEKFFKKSSLRRCRTARARILPNFMTVSKSRAKLWR